MLRGVPTEMHPLLLSKKTVKEAWVAIKSMRLGADRVKTVNAQKLLAEFESITFKSGETIEDFAIRISKIATDLTGLGEKSVDDKRVVRKFLRVVPPRYNEIALAIEMFCDLDELTVEELIGRLKAAEDRFEASMEKVTEKTGNLLLTEDEWAARNRSRMIQETSSSSGQKGGSGRDFVRKDKNSARGKQTRDFGERNQNLTLMGTPRRKGRCVSVISTGTLKKSARRR
jgi:hypothetical protein